MSTITFESLLKECNLDENDINERDHFPQILGIQSGGYWHLGAVTDIEATCPE